ncbi:nitric oxide synthase, salivary gland isoform X2 [Anthonomus grandis grandis]|uniref:nitric oxide synthase, salivary gland isoform X2 n=1 Tax=Anthonomus grandis grandis TaxID=2921223 RepID=UPI0021662050|nr:nitric oxide synthase, salivary gland isoform X2 [Anthonomus grandis grandis]
MGDTMSIINNNNNNNNNNHGYSSTELLDKIERNHFNPASRKPVRLKNVATRAESFDALHIKKCELGPCSNQVCLGSLMGQQGKSEPLRNSKEILRQARDFLDQYFTSIRRAQSPAHLSRWEQVHKEVTTTGTYQLTETELIYGAKLAWRNSVRCIGRIQWSKLQVFDCRYVTTTSGMFEALCNHIKYSTNKGNIRSAITIFPQRTDDKHDFRVWNPQLISYAGYKQCDGSVVGDPLNVEFTEVCQKIGWRGKGTRWDILPIVVSANGHDPDYFDLPKEYVLEVPLTHPSLNWFENLGLRWFALPAVSSMMFDCGGIQFTAAPFNGWYMSTEIGCRNLCDTQRLNMLETIALNMGLDTRTPVTLWKDKAMVECNLAVLHSFQEKGVTIVDHHTASESFMKHLENEVRLRNGCPADWVWIVPPLSGSATPVFHQEMALYYLKPSYEYQDPAWKCHVWKKGRESGKSNKPKRKFHFKQIARAVKFTSKLFGRALSRRIKATVLYATETGKSEGYAKKLGEIFGHAFNAQVYCMADYDISSIEHEALLLVVTSTFGNGDPPENGEEFANNLYTLKISENGIINGDPERLRFAVFALGSSAYPNFCAFGKYVDNLLGELGGERLIKLASGDEMCGQEQAFMKWAPQVFKLSCEAFCLDDDDTFLEATISLQSESLTQQNVRLIESKKDDTASALSKCHNKKVTSTQLLRRINLLSETASKATLLLQLKNSMLYKPGDHLGVFPVNRKELVETILNRVKGVADPDQPLELQILKETHTSNGVVKNWKPHERLPSCSLRDMFSRFLDITTPPSPNLLQHFASIATDEHDQKQLNLLATDPSAYEDWRHWNFPNLAEVLEEFPSVNPCAPLLVAQLTVLQPRFYSISSSPLLYPNEVHLTVAVVVYNTQGGDGPAHYGVCSNYLQDIEVGQDVFLFIRSAPNFYLPNDLQKPIILVGPGTGVAPFRAFWQHRYAQLKSNHKIGKIWLFFGCRTKEMDLYREEKHDMVNNKVLDRVFLALSREPNVPKTYIQDLAIKEAAEIYKLLVIQEGHFYVCGDCTMAEHVYQTLKKIIQTYGGMSQAEVQSFLLSLRDQNRYHEDIFGITLRTAEIHNKSRESARIRMASEP